MKIAFLFAGQGSQKIGMGKELYDQEEIVSDIFDSVQVDFDLKKLCFEGDKEQLDNTAYAQSCLFVTGIAIATLLKSKGIVPEMVAGLSLGEYTALCYAGCFDVQQGAQITRQRGKIMASAMPTGKGSMAAVLQMDTALLQEVCKEASKFGVCEIANYNCPGQLVITGESSAVEVASRLATEKGARRVIPLSVSGAFHSSLLKASGEKLAIVLDKFEIGSPQIPVVYNVSGELEQFNVKDLLVQQISSSVYFEKSIRTMIDQGIDTFIEIGPGSTLSGFVRKIDPSVSVYAVEDSKSFAHVLEKVGQ